MDQAYLIGLIGILFCVCMFSRIAAQPQVDIGMTAANTLGDGYELAKEAAAKMKAKSKKKTKDYKPKFIIYIIYHDDESKKVADEFAKAHKWAKPTYIRSTWFFESIVFRDVIPFDYNTWRTMDYVGVLSYKATDIHQPQGEDTNWRSFNGREIPYWIETAYYGDYDVMPFLRSFRELMPQALICHGEHFKVVWDYLLVVLGYDETALRRCDLVNPFFRNAFAMKTDLVKSYTKFVNDAIETTLHNEKCDVLFNHDAQYRVYKNQSVITQKIFQTEQWQFHPFVFERLPNFYFCANRAKVCNGGDSPCDLFWN